MPTKTSIDSRSMTWRNLATRVLAIVVLFFAANLLTGITLDFARNRCGKGESGIINSGIRAKPDILILGSSRAKHHFNDEILSNALGCNVYNAGIDGQGILFARVINEQIAQRHQPKIVIFDLMTFAEEQARIHTLSPWYNQSKILPEVLTTASNGEAPWKNKLLFSSPCYRYANAVWKTIKDTRAPYPRYGFSPTPPKAEENRPSAPVSTSKKCPVGMPWFIYQVLLLRDEVQKSGATLILTKSPLGPGNLDEKWMREALGEIEKNNIIIWEFTPEEAPPLADKHMYVDPLHLSEEGATIYTKLFAKKLTQFQKQIIPR